MAWTEVEIAAALDQLKAARALGVLTIRTADGRTVTYKSDKEMKAAIADLEDALSLAAGTPASKLVRVGMDSGVR